MLSIDPAITDLFKELHMPMPDALLQMYYLPRNVAQSLHRIVEALSEGTSLAITTNLHPAKFVQRMHKSIAKAIVDRLMHHARISQSKGDSARIT